MVEVDKGIGFGAAARGGGDKCGYDRRAGVEQGGGDFSRPTSDSFVSDALGSCLLPTKE
jgi:hypothetical protein